MKRLSRVGLLALRGTGRQFRTRLAEVLGGVSDQTINRLIRNNSDDLTKVGVLDILKEETGLEIDLLVEEVEDKDNSQN